MALTTDTLSLEPPRRFHFNWVLPALFRPRATLAQITGDTGGNWLTPILILTVTGLLAVMIAGSVLSSVGTGGPTNLPPDFQYWSQEQQQQFMEAQSSASGPMFVYVFPAVLAIGGVWVGWLVLGGLLHLILTLFGGRGSTRSAMNLVAWASLPYGVYDLIRAGYMLLTQSVIQGAGLSGFAPTEGGLVNVLLTAVLGLINIYLIWQAVMLVLGVQGGDKLPLGKAIGVIALTLTVFLTLQAIPGFIGGLFMAGTSQTF